MQRRLLRTSPILALALCARSVPAQNLVVNPGFETGDFTGWTTGGAPEVVSGSSSYVHSGTYGASLAYRGGDPVFITQDLTTVPGQAYQLSFYLHSIYLGTQLAVLFGDSPLGTVSTTSFSQFDLFNFVAMATSTRTTLTFVTPFGNAPALDDVSVTSINPVPEPSNLAALGLSAVAVLRRRKRA